MSILVATPARLRTPKALVERCGAVVRGLRYPSPWEWRLYLNEQPASAEKYRPNARARNELLDRFLRPWHEWVLWFDVDIITAPENLAQQLVEIATRHRKENGQPQIVAPMVWVERVAEGAPSIPVGGWFYDTGGFQQMDGRFADFEHGVGSAGDEVEMLSVGCVYLAPAELYREHGLRYQPEGGEVEHLSFMRQARGLGAQIWATRRANVIHAYLPKWGEQWHSS